MRADLNAHKLSAFQHVDAAIEQVAHMSQCAQRDANSNELGMIAVLSEVRTTLMRDLLRDCEALNSMLTEWANEVLSD